jgi:hypothetical protein
MTKRSQHLPEVVEHVVMIRGLHDVRRHYVTKTLLTTTIITSNTPTTIITHIKQSIASGYVAEP